MSTLLERLEYGFDRDSRRTWRRRALATGQDDAYGYDGLSQVLNAARGNLNLNATAIGGVPVEDEAWDYDPTGNWRGYRVEEDGAVTLDQHRVHDKGNRLTQIEGSAEPVLVDRAGRMRQVPPDAGGDWSEPLELVWDAWSRLVEVRRGGSAVGSYAYDGLNRRTTRTTGGGTLHSYYSDAWRPLEERQEGVATAALQYGWGARHRDDLVRRDRATTSGGLLEETRYVLMDYFSPAAITDADGNVTERYAFSAFGVRRILNPDFTPRTDSECDWEFAFQGQFLDTESGFLDYGFRYYSPYLGRWTCKDPIGERGGGNLYVLLRNNPIRAVDFLGLDSIPGAVLEAVGDVSLAAAAAEIAELIAEGIAEEVCPILPILWIVGKEIAIHEIIHTIQEMMEPPLPTVNLAGTLLMNMGGIGFDPLTPNAVMSFNMGSPMAAMTFDPLNPNAAISLDPLNPNAAMTLDLQNPNAAISPNPLNPNAAMTLDLQNPNAAIQFGFGFH